MADELASRRAARPNGMYLTAEESAALTSSAPKGKGKDGGDDDGKDKPPPLWRWFSAQTAHSDSARADAAKHVKDRWNLAFTYFTTIDRALAKEDSEYLIGFRELLDEYRALFDIADNDDAFARQTGVGGKMLPVGIERCGKCKREAIPGTGLCARHGGQWLTEKDIDDMSRQLRERVLGMSMAALRTLQELMDNARSEQVRQQSAMAILDRAGIGAHLNVNHSGSVGITSSDEAMDAIQARLDSLAVNIHNRAALEASLSTGVDPLGDIVDAEVVESPEPETQAR